MEDWSSGDYSRVYGDTLYVPPPGDDEGVYLLEEADRAADPGERARVRAPLRPYAEQDGRYGRAAWRGRYSGSDPPRPAGWGGGRREGFYGNVVSDRGDHKLRDIFEGDWDERPMHYNPNAGTDWAHLVPSPQLRPYGGGPAPNLAWPVLTQSEGLNNPNSYSLPSIPCRREGFAGGAGAGAGSIAVNPQLMMVILLFAIVVLLACAVAAARHASRGIDKLLRALAAPAGKAA